MKKHLIFILYCFACAVKMQASQDTKKWSWKNLACQENMISYNVMISDKALKEQNGVLHDLSHTNNITVNMFTYCKSRSKFDNQTYDAEFHIQKSPGEQGIFYSKIPHRASMGEDIVAINPGKGDADILGKNIAISPELGVVRVNPSPNLYLYFDIPPQYIIKPNSKDSKVIDRVEYDPAKQQLEWHEFSDSEAEPAVVFAALQSFSYGGRKNGILWFYKKLPTDSPFENLTWGSQYCRACPRWNRYYLDLKNCLEALRIKGLKFWFKDNQLQFSYKQLEKLPIPYPELMAQFSFADQQGFFLGEIRNEEVVWFKRWQATTIMNVDTQDTLLDTLYALYPTRFKFWFEKERLCFSSKQLEKRDHSCKLPFLLSRPKDQKHLNGVLEMIGNQLKSIIAPSALEKLYIAINYKGSLDGVDYKSAAENLTKAVGIYPRGIDIIFNTATTKETFAESISKFLDKNQTKMKIQSGQGPVIFTSIKNAISESHVVTGYKS